MPRVQIVYETSSTTSTTSSTVFGGTKPDGTKAPVILAPDTPKTITARGLARMDTTATLVPVTKITASDEFEKLRSDLLNHGELWCDPDFPAESKSVFPSRKFNVEWKRPKEISTNAQFVEDGFNRFDVRQGELGNCWFLAVVASLTLHDELFDRVVPPDQDFGEKYCGAFYFRFWQFGKWKEIVIDDRLPTRNGKLLFMHSTDSNEFWSALLEKAYAKVCGSYETLAGGLQSEAMEDFTGGLTETILFDTPASKSEKTLEIMLQMDKQSSLMGCCIDSEITEGRLPNGLYTGHAYSITGVRKIKYKEKEIGLVRVRNPWGEKEWNGAWSDHAPEWKNFSEAEKRNLELISSEDGEFWMSFEDFVNNFTKVEVCHLGPESFVSDKLSGTNKRRWEQCIETGSWQKHVNAGGCRNFLDTFITNPQFRVKVTDADENDDENLGTILIALMQKDQRKKTLPFNTVGYTVYALKDPKPEPLSKIFFRTNSSAARSEYINQREVFGRHRLPPGNYAIIPTTFEPDTEGSFILRILSERPFKSNEIDAKNVYCDTLTTISGKPTPSISKTKELTDEQRKEQVLKTHFVEFAGPTETINAAQLRDLLNQTVKKEISVFSGFNLEVCRSLVSLYDANQTGKVEFSEFQELWRDLRIWKNVFNEHDLDKTGDFTAYELRQALESSGFKVSNSLHSCLAHRYKNPEKGTISFEDFVLCVVRLRTAFENLKHATKDTNGKPVFEPDEFLRLSVYV